MPMEVEDFEDAMAQILAFFSKRDTDENERYLEGLFPIVKHMSLSTFERVCEKVASRMTPHKKPMPRDFLIVEREFAKEEAMKPRNTPIQRMTTEEHERWCRESVENMGKKGAEITLSLSEPDTFPPEIREALERKANS